TDLSLLVLILFISLSSTSSLSFSVLTSLLVHRHLFFDTVIFDADARHPRSPISRRRRLSRRCTFHTRCLHRLSYPRSGGC
ncbi:hypothetical protein DFH11DRAFT_1581854, partial [Phellopilus nigrolimitatus]